MSSTPFFPVDRTFIIAEIGNNHEGDFGVAKALVERAAECGVDAVKFQTFKTAEFVSPQQTERYQRMTGFELTFDQFTALAELAKSLNLRFISTPLDHSSARFLGGIVDAIKIASGDITHFPLISIAAAHPVPMILSTGGSTLEEVDAAFRTARKAKVTGRSSDEIAILHCVSAYPTPADQANLRAIHTLQSRYQNAIGYSDHTVGTEVAVTAVAMGARIIEKHFTLANDYSDFRDHQLSADPNTMANLVNRIRATEATFGTGEKISQPCEESSISEIRRSVAAARDMSAGEVITEEDLVWLRPASGLPPGQEHRVLGKPLDADLPAGSLIPKI